MARGSGISFIVLIFLYSYSFFLRVLGLVFLGGGVHNQIYSIYKWDPNSHYHSKSE